MNSYKQLSYRYLKANRKRTLFTLLGIVLSVALIATIGSFMKGAQQAQLENAYKRNGGSFHAVIQPYTDDVLNKISHNPKLSAYGRMSQKNNKAVNTVKLALYEADRQALEFLKYGIKEGNAPLGSDEAAVEEWVLPYLKEGLFLGETFQFNGKTYRLSGILENADFSQEKKVGRVLTYGEQFSSGEGSILLQLNPKYNLDETLAELKAIVGNGKVNVPDQVLTLLKPSRNDSLYVMLMIVVGIVVVSTIVVIYNAFQISIVDRMRQFGMLRSIGATKKQIRGIVFRETTLMSAIGIPIGLALCLLAIAVMNAVLKHQLADANMLFSLDWKILLFSVLISLASIFLSGFIPAIMAGRISPLLAISSRLAITKEKVQRSNRSKSFRKPRSFVLSLAMKNVKRSPVRYAATILSIIISCVLFITFTYLLNLQLMERMESPSSDLAVTFANTSQLQHREEIIQQLKLTPNISETKIKYSENPFWLEVPKGKPNYGLTRAIDAANADGAFIARLNITIFDDETMKKTAEVLKGRFDFEQSQRDNGVILIAGEGSNGTFRQFAAGESLRIQLNDESTTRFGEGTVHTVKVAALMDAEEYTKYFYESNYESILMSRSVAEKLLVEKLMPSAVNVELADETKHAETAAAIRTMDSSLTVFDHIDRNNKIKSSDLLTKVLVNGFTIVISLIGSVNIMNTLTVSIINRRKELAALKSIGMSQRDLKSMIRFEGLIYGFFGSLQGIVYGVVLSYILFTLAAENNDALKWQPPYMSCMIAFIASLAICYLSTLLPLRTISRDNVVEALREE
ncbi:FtsX-like permease family protein [Paenibacillus pasadenensis]|uniref:ABC transporter permease n=1 Tax=Paenibacillus pasadenensis TaxID=217090 RepID=UPI0020409909|nr:FtsX-like permease family protein [Paenibacillus pasadenensis]MCM3748576.1 FtsX-like permease family protein [Paenibacillus pasadenensis]